MTVPGEALAFQLRERHGANPLPAPEARCAGNPLRSAHYDVHVPEVAGYTAARTKRPGRQRRAYLPIGAAGMSILVFDRPP